MNPKFTFSSDAVKRGFAVAKLVKPKTGDYVLKIVGSVLNIVSCDARRYARAEVQANLDTMVAPPDYVSDEYFLSEDRKAILDVDSSDLEMSITAKGINLKIKSGENVKNAVIRKRPDNSRRPFVPRRLEAASGHKVLASSLEELFKHVSCSALVKDTKTEDDMRVNQVHFYSEFESAVSNARSHATLVKLPGLKVDSSIVSSDVPLLRTFCSKVGAGKDVVFGQTDEHVFAYDESTGDCVFAARVASKRPDYPFSGMEASRFSTKVEVKGDAFHSNVSWAVTAVEGTSRITFSTERCGDGASSMALLADGEQVASFGVTILSGHGIHSDFHIGCVGKISPFLSRGRSILHYGHDLHPTMMCIEALSPDPENALPVEVFHFIRSMVNR